MDGRVNFGKAEAGIRGFGLGYVLETLRDPSFAWWVRFEVDVANREAGHAYPDLWPWGNKNFDKYFVGFRFSQPNFDLNDYDQVWFFGDNPGADSDNEGVTDTIINERKYAPLDDTELRLLAEWMDRGGVFATGDHGLLGASLGSKIPRVRTMRR